MPSVRSSSFPAWAAFGWSLVFGLTSLYWAAGGTIGLSTLAETIQDRSRDGDTAFLLVTAVTGVLKIGAGLVALATIQRWGRSVPRWLLLGLVWGIGVGYTLYGVVNFVDKLLMLTGLRSTPDAVGDDVVIWYVLVWEPFWTLGGVLFLWAARAFQRTSAADRA